MQNARSYKKSTFKLWKNAIYTSFPQKVVENLWIKKLRKFSRKFTKKEKDKK